MFKMPLAIISLIMWAALPYERTLNTHNQNTIYVQYQRILSSSSFGEEDF